METRVVTGVDPINRKTSYRGTDDLLGVVTRIINGEKSIDEKISFVEIDD